jgi:DNA-binding transcriptional LysR family regulator
MDVRLKHVVAVAKSGSFTAAAREIGVSQSAVTRGVADLERQIGYDLFQRTARGALLTEFGHTFAVRAARLLDDEQALLNLDPRIREPFAGVLRLGVCPAILEWALIRAVATLKMRHPKIQFEVVGGPFERMAPMLRNGGIDLLIGFDEALNGWTDIRRDALWELKTSLFVRKGHPILTEPNIDGKLVSRFEIVAPSDSLPYGALIRALYDDHGVDWRKYIHVADFFPLVKKIVENSDAIGMVVNSHVASPSFQAKFDIIEGFELCQPTALCCASRAKWESGPIARAFIAAMRAFRDPIHRPLVELTE